MRLSVVAVAAEEGEEAVTVAIDLGGMLAFFDHPWFFMGVVIAIGGLAAMYVRAVKGRNDDSEDRK